MSIALDKLTPAQLDTYLHWQATIDRQAGDADDVLALRAYYDGNMPVLLTRRQREFIGDLLEGNEFPFSHNVTRSVIDTLRERLSVTGIAVHEETADENAENPVSVAMWQWWQKSRLDAQQIRLYRRALRDGLAYVIVDFDNEMQRPRFSLHHIDAGDQEPGVMLHRDPEDENRVLFACRYWRTAINPLNTGDSGKERKTVYLPGEIRKYIRNSEVGGAAWKPILDPEDNGVWPLPWVDRMGRPLGIPVIEFANPGGSEVAQIIGLQNALNKTWLDIIAAADTSGFPVVVVAYNSNGVPMAATQDDADDEGADELRLSPGRLLEVDDATVTRLEAANLSPMIDTMWTIVQAVSGVSRTPTYYLRPVGGGDVPSGEALKQLESGLVRRAEERQLVFGQAWQDVFALAYRINQAFGPSLPDVADPTIAVTWADANVRNELAEAQTAESHQRLGVPVEQLWRELGYTPEQIEQFKQGQLAEQQAKVAAVAAAMRVTQTASAQPAGQTNQQRTGANTNGVQNGQGQSQV